MSTFETDAPATENRRTTGILLLVTGVLGLLASAMLACGAREEALAWLVGSGHGEREAREALQIARGKITEAERDGAMARIGQTRSGLIEDALVVGAGALVVGLTVARLSRR